MSQTTLLLQGGGQFGPFPPGTLHIGTDPSQCQVVVPDGPGLAPLHAMIHDHGDGRYTVQPVQQGLLVLVAQGGGGLVPVTSSLTAQVGDAVVLGATNGPRLTLTAGGGVGPGAAAVGAGAAGAAGAGMMGAAGARYQRQGGFQKAMANEAQRQMRAKLVARNPVFRQLYQLQHRWRSGTFFQPRYVIGAIGGLIVLVGGFILSCGSAIFALLWAS